MLSRKRFIPVLFLSSCSLASYAEVDVNITTLSNDNARSVQKFNISINSDVPLKYVSAVVDTPEFCEQFFYLSSPMVVNSKQFSDEIVYNYKDHQWSVGQNLCLHIEDENGAQYSFASADSIALAKPELNVDQAIADKVVSDIEINDTYGLISNKVNYIYRPSHSSAPISFSLSGRVESDMQVTLVPSNSSDVRLQTISKNGRWQLDDIPITVLEGSRFTDNHFSLKGTHPFAPNVLLIDQRLSFSGQNLDINVQKIPQDPINESVKDSGVARWRLRTPVDIVATRLLMLTNPEQCLQNNPNADLSIALTNDYYDFLSNPATHGKFACLQVEDETGHLFTQSIGWVRKQALPEVIINDDIAVEAAYFDRFEGYVTGAETLKLTYMSDRGYLAREDVLVLCKNFEFGIPIEPNAFEFILSEASLHDHYVCLRADNGKGGINSWLSEDKINLQDGIEIQHNAQKRYTSTPYPTKLPIPEKLQNSTLNNIGCRGVLLAPDLALTAGHCDAPFFHAARGVWAQSPRTTTYLLAQDEEVNNVYETMLAEIIAYYLAHRDEDENITGEWLGQERQRLYSEYALYKTSAYRTYISPYFGSGMNAKSTFADFLLRDMEIPYDGDTANLSYAQPLVFTYPTDIHLTAGEFRGHGSSEKFPMSGWMGGTLHTHLPAGGNAAQYVLVDTVGGESGSALWAYDASLETYGVIGAVRGGGSWSSVWNHGRVTRQALAHSRAKSLQRRLDGYRGNHFSYRDLRRALADADREKLEQIIDSGIDVNVNGRNQQDGWLLARAIDFAVAAKNKLLRRNDAQSQQEYQARIDVIKMLMLGGADPRLTVIKPTKHMNIEAGDSVLHYAIRTNTLKIMQALWLNTTQFDFESMSRTVKNTAGDTPLHVAIDLQVDLTIFKLLFTDVGDNIFIENGQGESSLAKLLNQNSLNEQQVAYIDWIGKAFSYEPISINKDGVISHQDWTSLLCHRFEYQGSRYSFNEFAELRSNSLTPKAVSAITRLGNRSGVDASLYCQ